MNFWKYSYFLSKIFGNNLTFPPEWLAFDFSSLCSSIVPSSQLNQDPEIVDSVAAITTTTPKNLMYDFHTWVERILIVFACTEVEDTVGFHLGSRCSPACPPSLLDLMHTAPSADREHGGCADQLCIPREFSAQGKCVLTCRLCPSLFMDAYQVHLRSERTCS